MSWNVNLYKTGRVVRNTPIKANREKLMPHLTGSLQNDLKSFKTFVMHPTTEGVYGPGSYTDKSFTPVPQDRKRLLKWLASQTPGFTNDQKVLDDVKFEGDDLPSIPGPAKSVALTAVFHAMAGIVGQEISEMRRHKAGQLMINTNHVGLWLGTREKGFCGVTCFMPQAWRETRMGIALARHSLMFYGRQTYLPPTPPVLLSKSSDK